MKTQSTQTPNNLTAAVAFIKKVIKGNDDFNFDW